MGAHSVAIARSRAASADPEFQTAPSRLRGARVARRGAERAHREVTFEALGRASEISARAGHFVTSFPPRTWCDDRSAAQETHSPMPPAGRPARSAAFLRDERARAAGTGGRDCILEKPRKRDPRGVARRDHSGHYSSTHAHAKKWAALAFALPSLELAVETAPPARPRRTIVSESAWLRWAFALPHLDLPAPGVRVDARRRRVGNVSSAPGRRRGRSRSSRAGGGIREAGHGADGYQRP